VALVNNAQREHQEFMGTVDAVALENGQVFQHLMPAGVAVFPADEPYAELWQGLAQGKPCVRFSTTPGVAAEVSLLQAEWLGERWQVSVATPVGELNFGLSLAGRHNLRNALAVVACAVAAGVPLTAVAQGLVDFRAVKGRSRAWAIPGGQVPLTVVDDSYNANPDSVRAAIDLLASLPAPRLLVLGDMGEVGDQGPAFHAEAGAYAQASGIEHLFTLGELSHASAQSFAGARHFDDITALNQAVQETLPSLGALLVKGSRFMKMERVIEALPTSLNTGSHKNSKDGLTCS
jgi:UDP-N-acetylmuramoyl-tripeptide--D-alanyl-D-alanine ligase